MAAALSTAMAGLRANQASMAIISSNVANAQTPGYVVRSSNQVEISGDSSVGVRVTGVNRDLDTYLQTQLRTETSGASYAKQMATVLGQLQTLYGTPGGDGTLESALSNFTTALQSLSGSSGNSAAQSAVVSAAKSLASTLNSTTASIQALRSNAEQSLSNSASAVNNALSQIANINQRLLGMNAQDVSASTLMDQRDNAIDQLSQYMDVRVVTDTNNQATVYTGNGMPLVSAGVASQLAFDNHGQLNASTQWNSDPTKSAAGSMVLKLPNGASIDLTSGNAIVSGKIAADLKLRDQTLVQAQTQIDQFAATLATSLSDTTTSGTPTTSGTLTGFNLDLSGVQPGNTFNLTYTDSGNVQHQINVVRVDDAAALPLSNAGAPPNTQTIGVNFSGGMASVVAQLNTALGSAGLSFSNTGSTLSVLNTVAATANLTAASTTATATSLATGIPQLAVFTDGGNLYTGKITAVGSQMTGLAGRIAVNSTLSADPSKLTVYNTSPMTAAGDTTRSDFLYSQLTAATSAFSPATGLGSTMTPFKSTLTSYLQQVMTMQSTASTSASQLSEGQDVVVSTLQSKFNATSGVSIDNEMANLISLQNTYAANAHVMQVVQTMMDSLLQSVR
jgi:flagellar hook-associated protein 1 FlgK